MRKLAIILIILLVCLSGCFNIDTGLNQGSRAVNVPGSSLKDFTGVLDKEWKLTEVYVNDVNIQFSRASQPEAFKDIYVIKFDKEIVSGTGAPNLYSAPYTLGDNQAINIMIMRSTMMASFLEPVNLSEYEYFSYVQNSYEWRLINNNFELLSRKDNDTVRLIFGL